MLKNNKGVTLVELLIVIVVMGIIAAFAIPAVGNIITNSQKDSVVADALAVEDAAKLYCASNTCTSTQSLTWAQLDEFVSGLTVSDYELDGTGADGSGEGTVATLSGGQWTVTLPSNSVTGSYYWPAAIPSQSDRTNVATT